MITGMENTYAASLATSIESAIESATGSAPTTPNGISALATGIANAEIPFLVTNVEVDSEAGTIE